jgi:predicted DNA-binding ribbon-helix-helix protein
MSKIIKRSMTIAGHSTSISLEDEFWQALNEIALKQGLSLAGLVASIDAERIKNNDSNLSSALRVYVLKHK